MDERDFSRWKLAFVLDTLQLPICISISDISHVHYPLFAAILPWTLLTHPSIRV